MNNQKQKRLLLADNSTEYRHSVIGFLELEGYMVEEAGTLEEAQEKLELEDTDLLLVGLRMRNDQDPNDMSGLEIAKFASELAIPCIIVTAYPTVELARVALRSRGTEPLAKGLIMKSKGPQALLDSIRLILHDEDAKQSKKGLFIDLEKGLVSNNGELVELTKNQYILLAELYKKNDGLLSSAELIRAIYGEEIRERIAQSDPRILNLVDRIKQKIERKGSRHELLETIPGQGYRLNPRLLRIHMVDLTPDKSKEVPETHSDAGPNKEVDFNAVHHQEVQNSQSGVLKGRANQKLKLERPLRVFLCHSSGDKPAVRKLYGKLSKYMWIDPWLDAKKILPGDDWDFEIRRAVRTADIVLVCLTRGSVTKEGYVQKEIKQALDVADEKPDGTTYVIPLKLESCDMPDRLLKWHWLNYYEEGAHKKLLLSLRKRALVLNIKVD